MEGAACTAIPVVRVPSDAFFAMKVGVDGHALNGLERVDKFMSPCPVPFCVPPEGLQWSRQARRRGILGQRPAKIFGDHGLVLAFRGSDGNKRQA
jgi:hypothetical protein